MPQNLSGPKTQASIVVESAAPSPQAANETKAPRWHRFVIALLLAAMLAQGVSNILGMSITWDETMYVGLGDYILRTGHIDYARLEGLHFHPIWTFYLNSVFLLFLHLPSSVLHIPPGSVYTKTASEALLFHSGYSPHLILFLIRLPILLQSLLLAWLVYRFAFRLFGPNAGLVALAALAFDPNFLAHSAIACTDSSITVWLFASVYAYWEYLRAPSRRKFWLTGFCIGIAALSKVNSPILLLFILPGMYLAHRRSATHGRTDSSNGVGNGAAPSDSSLPSGRLSEEKASQTLSWRHLIGFALVMVFMIWAAYGFGLSINYKSDAEIKAAGLHGTQALLYSNKFIHLPLAPYVGVLMVVMKQQNIPRHAYLFGHHSPMGFRSYIFFCFLIKTAVPILALLAATLALWKRLPRADRVAETGIALGILVPLLFAIPEHSDCGIRYVLPIYPFLYVFLSRLAGTRWRNPLPTVQRWAPVVLVLLLCWNATESVLACPNQIAYFNTFFRDPATKYRYLVDSNLDWGNELLELRAYMQAHHIPEISLEYFGNTDPINYGIHWKQATGASTGYVAISATDLAGVTIEEHVNEFAAFRAMKPVAILGDGGMMVYHR